MAIFRDTFYFIPFFSPRRRRRVIVTINYYTSDEIARSARRSDAKSTDTSNVAPRSYRVFSAAAFKRRPYGRRVKKKKTEKRVRTIPVIYFAYALRRRRCSSRRAFDRARQTKTISAHRADFPKIAIRFHCGRWSGGVHGISRVPKSVCLTARRLTRYAPCLYRTPRVGERINRRRENVLALKCESEIRDDSTFDIKNRP